MKAAPTIGVYPSFPLYVGDWFGSRAVATMTLEQQGAYLRLLLHAWPTSAENLASPCTLPDDDEALAMLSGLGLEKWATLGAKVRAQFQPIGDGLLRNAKQHAVYTDLYQRSTARSEAGRKGMASRWGSDNDTNSKEDNNAITPALPPVSVSVSEPEENNEAEALFAQAWELMLSLKRPGNPKKLAKKMWDARIREGIPPLELLEATKRYVAFCAATGKVGTETVLMGATFFGPNERWCESYTIAATPGKSPALDRARERWRFYLSESLTDTVGFKERLETLVARGEWPSMAAAEAEMRAVRPWDIFRTARGDATKAVFEVARKLGEVAA